VSFGFDITKLKEIEKQLIGKANELERSNRDLENFAHMASHDFKAPLRVIHSFLQLLEKRSYQKFDETDKEYINYISNSVKILGQLTEDLLSYSKIDKNIGEPKTFDLKDVLELVKVNLKTIIDEKKAIVEYHDLPKVYAHMSLMTHLFQNLITNGIKYNKNEIPRIVINAIQQKEEIIFSIEDNGIGIEPEYFRSIFQMFRRLHPHSEYEGSGIGLTLCKKIVETYDGEVWVESRPGKGSNFFFTLPKAVIPVLQLEETSINL
jgi:light-regulated signal transduction histidine kinase (bacteriophytochrome)